MVLGLQGKRGNITNKYADVTQLWEAFWLKWLGQRAKFVNFPTSVNMMNMQKRYLSHEYFPGIEVSKYIKFKNVNNVWMSPHHFVLRLLKTMKHKILHEQDWK